MADDLTLLQEQVAPLLAPLREDVTPIESQIADINAQRAAKLEELRNAPVAPTTQDTVATTIGALIPLAIAGLAGKSVKRGAGAAKDAISEENKTSTLRNKTDAQRKKFEFESLGLQLGDLIKQRSEIRKGNREADKLAADPALAAIKEKVVGPIQNENAISRARSLVPIEVDSATRKAQALLPVKLQEMIASSEISNAAKIELEKELSPIRVEETRQKSKFGGTKGSAGLQPELAVNKFLAKQELMKRGMSEEDAEASVADLDRRGTTALQGFLSIEGREKREDGRNERQKIQKQFETFKMLSERKVAHQTLRAKAPQYGMGKGKIVDPKDVDTLSELAVTRITANEVGGELAAMIEEKGTTSLETLLTTLSLPEAQKTKQKLKFLGNTLNEIVFMNSVLAAGGGKSISTDKMKFLADAQINSSLGTPRALAFFDDAAFDQINNILSEVHRREKIFAKQKGFVLRDKPGVPGPNERTFEDDVRDFKSMGAIVPDVFLQPDKVSEPPIETDEQSERLEQLKKRRAQLQAQIGGGE